MTSSSYVIRDVAMQWHPVTNIGSTSGGGKLTDPCSSGVWEGRLWSCSEQPRHGEEVRHRELWAEQETILQTCGEVQRQLLPSRYTVVVVSWYFISRMEDLEKKKIQNQYFITWLATLKIFHQSPHTLVFLCIFHELWPLFYDDKGNKRFAFFLEGIYFLHFLFLVMINFRRFVI